MSKHLVVYIFLFCLLVSGCTTIPKQNHSSTPGKSQISLDEWINLVAIPYLVKELGENPRFKGEPYLLVSMNRDNIKAGIDDLTMQVREDIIDGLLKKPGIGPVWRPSIKPWEHHTTINKIQCNKPVKEKYYIGIDCSISSITGLLNIRIRALDIDEKKWVSNFGILWQGSPSTTHANALLKIKPDDYLLGLRPLPFNENQADLLASYLSRNLSCLFSNMELDTTIVHVKKQNPGNIEYFDNALSLLANYLARHSEVQVTDDPSKANITVLAKVQLIHTGLYQVWASARYSKDKKYVPGRETEAYAFLSTEMTVQKEKINKSLFSEQAAYSKKRFDLCFYYHNSDFETKIYPILKNYPGVTMVQRLYDKCARTRSCLCYEITVASNRYARMEELIQWLDIRLDKAVTYKHFLKPLSSESIRIMFAGGKK